ncbi:unnamed protein product, partial [Rotaria magnacalcarata]
KRERESKDVESMFKLGAAQAEAATATTATAAAATTVASNAKTKKNEPETALHKNNPQQMYFNEHTKTFV